MFKSLFRKNRTVVADHATTNLATLLMLTMTAELSQAKEVADVPEIGDMRDAYNRLVRLNMDSTQNALALRARILQHEKAKENYVRARKLIEFMKEAQMHFGPKTILVSYEAFNNLCEKYDLATGPLEDYCGVIPAENIADIDLVTRLAPYFRFRDFINRQMGPEERTISGYLLKVKSLRLNHDEECLEWFVKKNNNIVRVVTRYGGRFGYWMPKDLIDARKNIDYKWEGLSEIYGKIFEFDTMFIACPKKYLKNPNVVVSKRLVDPAIFQYTPYGVLVHTVWGEEAEDSVLKKFMELNASVTLI